MWPLPLEVISPLFVPTVLGGGSEIPLGNGITSHKPNSREIDCTCKAQQYTLWKTTYSGSERSEFNRVVSM